MSSNFFKKAAADTKVRKREQHTGTADRDDVSERRKFAEIIAKGFTAGLAVAAIMLCIFAVIIVKKDISERIIQALSVVAVSLGTFAGGFVSARLMRKNGLFAGLITSIPVAAVIILTVALFCGGSVSIVTVVAALLMLIAGAVGGITAVNIKSRVPK